MKRNLKNITLSLSLGLALALSAQAQTTNPLKLFKDITCSELKPGVNEKAIKGCKDELFRETASALYKGTYDSEFRIQEYKQYQHPDIMGIINKTNAYSLLDNATGIVAREGKELVIAVGELNGDSLGIKIQNLLRPNGDGYVKGSSTYTLTEGINRIIPKNDGLVYVLYHTKTEILKLYRKGEDKYWKLSFGKRDAEELYNIRKDPECMQNLIDLPQYQTLRRNMAKEMLNRLLEQGDPRLYGQGDIFDQYPDVSPAKQFYNRTKAGEKVPFGWINESDFEK